MTDVRLLFLALLGHEQVALLSLYFSESKIHSWNGCCWDMEVCVQPLNREMVCLIEIDKHVMSMLCNVLLQS